MNTVGLLSQIGIMNPFNRKQESEADYLGLIFSSLSGYDIRETTKIWERMKEANKGKTPPEFMSTHPSSDNRIKKISGWLNEIIIDYPPIRSNLVIGEPCWTRTNDPFLKSDVSPNRFTIYGVHLYCVQLCTQN